MTTLKKGQAEQQAETSKQQAEQKAERAKVLNGLKAVEKVAKRLDQIEEVQVKHGQKLSTHDDALGLHEDSIKRIKSKAEEGEKRMKKVEDQIEKINQNGVDMRQCNAVAREVREMEKREKNIVLFNLPEPKETDDGDARREDSEKIERHGFGRNQTNRCDKDWKDRKIPSKSSSNTPEQG